MVTARLGGMPMTVIVAVAEDLGSVTEVAVSVTVGGLGALDGAV